MNDTNRLVVGTGIGLVYLVWLHMEHFYVAKVVGFLLGSVVVGFIALDCICASVDCLLFDSALGVHPLA